MRLDQSFENVAYTVLFIIGGIGLYILQHEGVRIGCDAAISAYDYVHDLLRANTLLS